MQSSAAMVAASVPSLSLWHVREARRKMARDTALRTIDCLEKQVADLQLEVNTWWSWWQAETLGTRADAPHSSFGATPPRRAAVPAVATPVKVALPPGLTDLDPLASCDPWAPALSSGRSAASPKTTVKGFSDETGISRPSSVPPATTIEYSIDNLCFDLVDSDLEVHSSVVSKVVGDCGVCSRPLCSVALEEDFALCAECARSQLLANRTELKNAGAKSSSSLGGEELFLRCWQSLWPNDCADDVLDRLKEAVRSPLGSTRRTLRDVFKEYGDNEFEKAVALLSSWQPGG